MKLLCTRALCNSHVCIQLGLKRTFDKNKKSFKCMWTMALYTSYLWIQLGLKHSYYHQTQNYNSTSMFNIVFLNWVSEGQSMTWSNLSLLLVLIEAFQYRYHLLWRKTLTQTSSMEIFSRIWKVDDDSDVSTLK